MLGRIQTAWHPAPAPDGYRVLVHNQARLDGDRAVQLDGILAPYHVSEHGLEGGDGVHEGVDALRAALAALEAAAPACRAAVRALAALAARVEA